MIYFCSQKNRRALVSNHPTLNGIDYLEVDGGPCSNQLTITLLKNGNALALGKSQVRITGGGPGSQVSAVSVSPCPVGATRMVTIDLDKAGDFSTYTLSLVANPSTDDPPDNLDPQLSTVCFSFKAGCPSVADCAPDTCCPPDTTPEPDINYLAKDFGGFRQVMLDRMAVIAPGWNETHASDMGIALVEILAYAADHLSYQQDSVGTEAYIGTARSRISMRRHAKLVDYQVQEGSNARLWVYMYCVHQTGGTFIPAGTLVFPRVPGFPTLIAPGSPQAATLLKSGLGFATMQDIWLHEQLNQMQFYTWDDAECCLAPGATCATLAGHLDRLQAGAILIFQEMMGPQTGNPADANPANRWAVRLTEVRTTNYKGKPLVDPLNGKHITRISWAQEDALPFPLCLSSTVGSQTLPAVSVALGNIVPADHGIWQVQTVSGTVSLTNASTTISGHGTTFTNTLQAGQWLVFASDDTATPYQIDSILNDTALILASEYTGASTAPNGPTIAAILEDLGVVPGPSPAPVTQSSCTCGNSGGTRSPLPRYFPRLANSPVTFAYAGIVELTGTIVLTSNSTAVAGANTSFTTALTTGQSVVFSADPSMTPYVIASISGDESLTLTSPYTGPLPVGAATAAVVNTTPASEFLAPSTSGSSRAVPQIAIWDDQRQPWTVLNDLLSSNDSQRVCVMEIERDGTAFIRFGDDQYGAAAEQGMDFVARYRVGNGSAGNIGRDSLGHLILSNIQGVNVQGINYIGNPLPAAGGVDPETIGQIRQQAPFAFRTQLRAVTEDDYGAAAQQNPAVREARGTLRWTGSWYTAFVSLDTFAANGPDAALVASTESSLNLLRMAGVDLAVEGATIVGLRIEMDICVDPDYFQQDVESALMQIFTTGNQCSGVPGILNPDNFTFGQTIYSSPLIAAAQGVQGVTAATLTVFQRMDDPSIDGAALGYLTMGRLDIARCDNDPNRLDHGIFVLHMEGGK